MNMEIPTQAVNSIKNCFCSTIVSYCLVIFGTFWTHSVVDSMKNCEIEAKL